MKKALQSSAKAHKQQRKLNVEVIEIMEKRYVVLCVLISWLT